MREVASTGTQAWWWNGASWVLASNQTYNASTGCVTITVKATGTVPTLSQLGGTPFGIGNAPPVVSVPGAQSVQYSDPLSFQVSATDAESGDTLTLRASGLPAGLTFHDNGNGTGTVSGSVTAPAGTYTATFTANDGHSDSSPKTVTIVVTLENTIVKLAQNNPSAVQVTKAGGSAPAMTVSARITEVSDGSYGNITKASPVNLTLNPIGSGTKYTCTVPSSSGSVTQTVAATSTSPGFEVVSCTFPAGTAVNVYDLNVSVGGTYYQGSGDGALAVYDLSQSGVQSGGGLMKNPMTGNTVSFGFTASYNSSGGVVGKMLYVETDANGNEVAVLKGNVMSTMAITKSNGAYPETVKISGKATLNGNGNYSYVLQGVDSAGTATDADQYGIAVTNPTGAGVSTLTFTPQTLLTNSGVQIGNIYVK